MARADSTGPFGGVPGKGFGRIIGADNVRGLLGLGHGGGSTLASRSSTGSTSTWGRRLLEADVRSLRAQLQARKLFSKAEDERRG